jgi:hypothetical protein
MLTLTCILLILRHQIYLECHSAALANDNLDCQINDISQETVQHWENMKNIGSKAPKIKAENLIYFGFVTEGGRR